MIRVSKLSGLIKLVDSKKFYFKNSKFMSLFVEVIQFKTSGILIIRF